MPICSRVEKFSPSQLNTLFCCNEKSCSEVADSDLTCRDLRYTLVNCHKISEIEDCKKRNDEEPCKNSGDPNKIYCLTMDLSSSPNDKQQELFCSERDGNCPYVDDYKFRNARSWTLDRRKLNESFANTTACCKKSTTSDNCWVCEQGNSLNTVKCDDMFKSNPSCFFKFPNGTQVKRVYNNEMCTLISKGSSSKSLDIGLISGILSLIVGVVGVWIAWRYRTRRNRRENNQSTTEETELDILSSKQ